MGKLRVTNCKTEYREKPLGVDAEKPRFSWNIESEERDTLQNARQIIVKDESGTIVWDSGEVNTSEMSELRVNFPHPCSHIDLLFLYFATISIGSPSKSIL